MNAFSEKSDAELVEYSLLGNDSAYTELVLRHEKSVKGTAYKITGNRYSAEDASQDAFLSAWMRLDTLKDGSRFGAWVCAIAKNCAISLNRKYRTGMADISFHLLENADLEGNGDELLARALEEERDRELHEAVDCLTEKTREVVRMHYFEGLSVSEIATRLSLPAGTVKWRLSEGRKQLRKGYGVMEEIYNENEPLLSRVRKQIEKLKFWRMKANKTGFEPEYRAVLESVESLADGVEKESALADTLLMGYWWLPGERNETVLARIKAAAEAGHNEDVMQGVISEEVAGMPWEEKIRFLLEEKIPYLEQNHYRKALGYAWYQLGAFYNTQDGKRAEELEAYRKAKELLHPSELYYTLSQATSELMRWKDSLPVRDGRHVCAQATVTALRRVGSKLYKWQDVGSGFGSWYAGIPPIMDLSACDGLLLDENRKVGDVLTSSDGRTELSCIDTDRTVDTPAGRFDHCSVFRVTEEDDSFEAALCEGVGIVWAKVTFSFTQEIHLSDYTVVGGSGLLPLAEGNCWSYQTQDTDGAIRERSNTVRVVYSDGERSVLWSERRMRLTGFREDTWEGNMMAARFEYCDMEDKAHDVRPYLQKAALLAKTERQKRHTAIATNVMERILATEPEFNPAYTEKGRWNFFGMEDIRIENGTVKACGWMETTNFEWKNMGWVSIEGRKLLFSFLDRILQTNAGALWSDKWVAGYQTERKYSYGGCDCTSKMSVSDGGTVETPAGTFRDCRRLDMYVTGMKGGFSYMGSEQTYWFAPGVGIVQFSRPLNGGVSGTRHENIWQLTAYEQTGEGYFPISDGLFRRFEPAKKLTEGWHGSLELLFDIEGDSILMFRNALGTQDRVDYEKTLKKKNNSTS